MATERGQHINPAVTYSGVPSQYAGWNEISHLLAEVLGDLSSATETDIKNDVNQNYKGIAYPKIRGPGFDGQGSSILRGDMLVDPKAEIRCSPQLKVFIEYLITMAQQTTSDDPFRPRLDALLGYCESACALKQLDRFLDARNPPLNAFPLEDGSNLSSNSSDNPTKSEDFVREAALREFVVRWLHYRGLRFFAGLDNDGSPRLSNERINDLKDLYINARGLLEKELLSVQADANDMFSPRASDFNASAVKELGVLRGRIKQVLEQVAARACRQQDPRSQLQRMQARQKTNTTRLAANLLPLTPREEEDEYVQALLDDGKTPLQNLTDRVKKDGVIFLDSLISETKSLLGECPPLTQIMIDLVRREDNFEKLLTVEHFEDKLISKQVTDLDELRVAQQVEWPTYFSIKSLHSRFESGDFLMEEKMIYKMLRDMSLVNRHRRNFRLIREWVGRRPWKQIYRLYDSTNPNEVSWAGAGIPALNHFLTEAFRGQAQNPRPTAYINVIPQLFGFRPIDIGAANAAQSYPMIVNQNCSILTCKQPFRALDGGKSIVVQLHCTARHVFHLQCIFAYWDSPGKYLHDCPVCGEMARLNYETAGINLADYPDDTFAHNNQAYNLASVVTPFLVDNSPVLAAAARKYYDVPEEPASSADPATVTLRARQYWRRQNKMEAALNENRINPFRWIPWTFAVGQRPRIPIPLPDSIIPYVLDPEEALDPNEILSAQERDALVTYRAAELVRGAELTRRRALGLDTDIMFDRSQVRYLSSSRSIPVLEAAAMRRDRRRRDKKRRADFLAAGAGLAGLK